MNDKKSQEQQCSSLDFSVQDDCCDSKPDFSDSVNLNKLNHVSSVYPGFEEDNTIDDGSGELNRNSSFIGMQQQLHNPLSSQLAHQQNCKSISNQILFSTNGNDSVGLLNCHQLNNQINHHNRFASTFSPTHHHQNHNQNNYNSIDKYNFFQNTIYSTDSNSPQKIANSVPQSASFYNMQTYTPIYTSATAANQAILGAYTQQALQQQQQQQQQQPQTTFQQLQPAQLLISNQSDNENGSTTTTMTTIGSQTDSSSSTEIANNSANGILHANISNMNNLNTLNNLNNLSNNQQIHTPLLNNQLHNNQANTLSPSNYNPVTLQILTTPQHLNDANVQLTATSDAGTIYQQSL